MVVLRNLAGHWKFDPNPASRQDQCEIELVHELPETNPQNSIVISCGAAAAIAVAGQEIQALVGSFGDVAQTAETAVEKPFESHRLARVMGIKLDPVKGLAAQAGEKQRAGPGSLGYESRARRRPGFAGASVNNRSHQAFFGFVAANFWPTIVLACFDKIQLVAAATLKAAWTMLSGV
jgi:hypothetical protein